MEKIKVTQDTLYEYLKAHGVKMVRIAEMLRLKEPSVSSCFNHHMTGNGVPRYFTKPMIVRLNMAIESISEELRDSVMKFGSPLTYTNNRGKTYDPALVENMKRIGRYINITEMTGRILGWKKEKCNSTISATLSRNYGCITEADANRINQELLEVAAVLSSYEVVFSGVERHPKEEQEDAE